MTKINRWMFPALFALTVSCVLVVSIYKPYYTWDLVLYIAAAKSYEESDINSIHAFTYNTLQHSVPEEVYLRDPKTDRSNKKYSHFDRIVYEDVSAFEELMPFYNIRPIYVGLVYLLDKAGMNIVSATHIISGVAVAIALVLLYTMSLSILGLPLGYAIPFFALIFGVTDIARTSTPDGIAFLAIVLSAYLYLKVRIIPLLIVLPLMIGVRTDLILYSMPLLLVMFFAQKGFRTAIAASMIITTVIYFVITELSGNGGWATIFYHTLIQLVTHPLSNPPVLTIQDYLRVLFYGVRNTLDDSVFILYLLVSISGLGLIINRMRMQSLIRTLQSPTVTLFIVCLVCVLSRLVLFPITFGRFFAGLYMIETFALLMIWKESIYKDKLHVNNQVINGQGNR